MNNLEHSFMNHLKLIPNQKGTALIISLIMLLVMSILAISSATITTMEEKMAGNIRNKHMSFQAAETALRAAELAAGSIPVGTVFDGSNGYYQNSLPAHSNFPIWDWEGTPAITWQAVTSNTGTIQNPEYIIEAFGSAFRDASCSLIVPLPPDCEVPIYRVTARGWGLNTNAVSILQSTFQ